MSSLSGIRVLDLTRVVAGPLLTKQLADLGAEIIKVESIQVPDETRYQRVLPAWPENQPGDRPWNSTWYFNNHNRNKRAITVDIASGWGQEIIKQLASISDLMIDNFRPGVLDKVGLHDAAIREVAPDIITMSMSGFGDTGPWRRFRAYGTTVEFMSGLASLTGYENDEIVPTGQPYGDWCSAMIGTTAVLMALLHRRWTGEGQRIDLSESEALTSFIADEVLAFGMTGEQPPRMGNHHPTMAPHNFYRCAGDDRWIAIAVEDDGRWERLCGAMSLPDLAADERFATVIARKANEADLDAIVEAWTMRHDNVALFHRLQTLDIACGPVANGKDILLDPHLKARGYWQDVSFPADRQMPTLRFARDPIVIDGDRPGIRFPAPDLGEHNSEILTGLLGITAEEMEALAETEIIGTRPLSTLMDFSPTDISLLEAQGLVGAIDPDHRAILGLDDAPSSSL